MISQAVKESNDNQLFLVLMAGLPGVGKSSVAKELSKQMRMALLDKDDILDYLKNSSIKDPLEQGYIAYDVLFQLIKTQLSSGVSVIVDTCLTFKWLRARLLKISSLHKARPVIVLCECSSEVAKERIIGRQEKDGEKYAERTWAEHERIKEVFVPLDGQADVTLDTNLAPEKNAVFIVSFLTN